MSIIDNSTPLTLNPTQNLQMINTINTNTQSFVNCNMLSNSIFITSNTLNIKINTKQDTLTAGTTLLGVGSSISALDYNKITLNKPTNFQADWNSTIINKPTIYTQTETNNLLNAKEQILSFTAPLTRTTNTIGINLSSYSTTGNDANYLLKTGGTLTGALNGTTINASTNLQEGAINLTSKYLQLTGGAMTANANITLSGTGTFTGIHSGNGSGLTNLPLSAYSTTGNDANYLLKTGGTLTGALNGTTINASTNLQEGAVNLTSKYLKLDGTNTMIANANITLSGTGTFNGIHSGNGSAINALDYNNITLNKPDLNIFSNVLYTSNYTEERTYPPKLYNSFSSQSVVTYLNQTPTYYETFTLTTADITYGSGTYEVRSSTIDDTTISYTGTGSTSNIITGNSAFSYIIFPNSGTFTINNSLICDILVVGGGGGGGRAIGSGGGAGGVVYITNYTLNAGTYSIIVGNGGAPMQTTTDVSTANGGNSIFRDSNNNDIITALGGAIGSSQSSTFNGTAPKSGGSGAGGTRNGITGGSGIQTTNLSISAISRTNGYGNAGGNGTNTAPWPAGGGGGAGSAGGIGSGTVAGNGGIGIQINITGTNTYYAGGGGGGGYNDGTYINTVAGTGGLGGGGNGSLGSANASSGIANTGGGGGGCGGDANGNGIGGSGGSGVVIIRFLNPTITTKKELFNLITNDSGCTFKTNQYNISTGNYLTTNRYINNYYGDWIIIKKPYAIYLTKYRIYNRPSFIERAPSLFKIFASTDGSIYDEIINASNNTTALTTSSYSSGYFEKIVNYFTKPYLYFALVVNKIIGGNVNSHLLNFTEFQIFGKEFINITPNIYSKTETNNLLDAKQATLTAATTLLGTGGSITAIDYNKITVNPLTFTSPLSKSAENAVSINLSSYSTTGNDSSYVLKSGSTITGNLTINGTLSGAVNVSRRAQFTFTPSQVLIGGLGLRYIFNINLNNYITGINSSISGINRVFRITIWGESGDFGDSTNNVETMQFLIFMSFFAGINGGKRRIYQIINESNGSTISYSNAETVYYNGWNGTGGAAQKFCIIENIAGY
jgi:hypothetical protein